MKRVAVKHKWWLMRVNAKYRPIFGKEKEEKLWKMCGVLNLIVQKVRFLYSF